MTNTHADTCRCFNCLRKKDASFWWLSVVGISSFVWLLLRSGRAPRRLQYPCQKIAAANSLAFLSWLAAIISGHFLFKKLNFSWKKISVLGLLIVMVYGGIKTYKVFGGNRLFQIAVGAGTPKVVWTHDTGVAGNYASRTVDQNKVNQMTDRGLLALTGAASLRAAWQTIIPNYQAGQKIAIKVNLNNSYACSSQGNGIDAVPEPINGLLRSLTSTTDGLGVRPQDIWVYDATKGTNNVGGNWRSIPNWFSAKITALYPGVQFYDTQCHNNAAYNNLAGSAISASGYSTHVADLLVQTNYLINIPVLKKHGGAGVSLAFKNHFGSIYNLDDNLHNMVYGANPGILADIYNNPNIRNKTVLTVGDGLYSNKNDNITAPTTWTKFGGQYPNSLLFSQDPVAIDSVMVDMLSKETYPPDAYFLNYLTRAASLGLGVRETGGDPFAASAPYGYSQIELVKCFPNCPNQGSASPTPIPPSHCLPLGDIDCSGTVNTLDFVYLISKWGTTDAKANLNDAGLVDSTDLKIMLGNWGK